MTDKSKLKKCPKTIGVSCSIRECADCVIKDAYEQGKSDGRKQTLEEVLKMADKFNIFEESDTGAIKFIEWLEREVKGVRK